MIKIKNLLVPILLILLIVVSSLLVRECQRSNSKDDLIELKGQEVIKTKNKLGETTSSIRVLEVQNKDLKKSIKLLNDSSYKRILQIERQWRRKLVAATTFNVTTLDTARGTTVIIPGGTVVKDSITYLYPTYTSKITKKYSEYDVTATRDGTIVISKIENPIDVATHYEKTTPKNFLRRKHLYTDVHTYNHTSEANEVRSFNSKERKRYTAIKVVIGVALIETLRIVLTK
jgi:hypothetical protein